MTMNPENAMNSILKQLSSHKSVLHADDERSLGNGIIVMLKDGYEFSSDPGCGTRGFDTPSEALSQVMTTARLLARAPFTPRRPR